MIFKNGELLATIETYRKFRMVEDMIPLAAFI